MGNHDYLHCRVIGCYEVKPGTGIIWLTFAYPESETIAPGQFVFLKPLHSASEDPKPFSVFYSGPNSISLLIKVAGPNTKKYSELNVNDKIWVSSPKGKELPYFPNRDYILVGGGIGSAALKKMEVFLKSNGICSAVIIGARNEKELGVYASFFSNNKKLKTIVDKSGYATDLLAQILEEDRGRSIVIACGPDQMLCRYAEIISGYENLSYVILEEYMGCGGTGACKGCAVFGIDGEVKYLCQEGPCFETAWIDWGRKRARIEATPIKEFEKPPINPLEVILKGVGGELKLRSPLIPASGCFDIKEDGPTAEIENAGALMVKGIKMEEVRGNPASRICGINGGLINSIGFAGKGIKRLIKEDLGRWLSYGLPVFVNITGKTVEEFGLLARMLDQSDIAGIEVNVSCPNIDAGGILFGTDPQMTQKATEAVRKETNKFVMTKLSPMAGLNIVDMAKAAEEGGADAVSLINTIAGRVIDINVRRYKIGNGFGGMSGPAIFPAALWFVEKVAKALNIPICGIGGIDDPDKATQMILAGACLIQVGTGLFKNPNLMTDISDFWTRDYFPKNHISHIGSLVGVAR
jgi:dihydroorotate dehydrogenase (NAD+) catalytic subunit